MPKPTYEIKVYQSYSDYEGRQGDLIEEGIPSKKEARRIAKQEYETGFYAVIKVQSSDREFIEVLPSVIKVIK